MFNISIKNEDYLTYILKDEDNNSHIEIVPEKGGIITKWKKQGQDLFYLDQERFKNPQLSVRGGNPILFPICGNLPDNIFHHKDKEYQLKQHGFARDLPWQVVAQSCDEKSAHLTLRLVSNEETMKVYPFEFEVNFTYKLVANKIIIEQEYINKSTEIMPFSAGFHPYFWCQDKQQLELIIPATEYRKKVGETVYPFDGTLDYEQEEIDIAFTNINSARASFLNRKRNHKITLEYSDFFTTLVFWTVKGKDFICLEPWSAPRNAINTGDKLIHLQPQQTHQATLEMSVTGI